MRVLLLRQPHGTVEGIALRRYRVGQTYDVSQALAEYLVAEGYALIEMRQDRPSQRTEVDRRRTIR